MKCQRGGEKRWQQKRFGCFTVNWVFCVSQFPAQSDFLSSLTSLSCKYFSISTLSACLSVPLRHLLLILLTCTQMIFFSWICFHFLLSLPGPVWFNLVSETFLKARAGKEFNISFSPVVFFTVCGLTAGWLTINQASHAATPSPWVSKSALAECNILKWPSAEWLIKFTNYEEILNGLLVFTLRSMFNSERLFSPEKFTVHTRNVWKGEAQLGRWLSEPSVYHGQGDKSDLFNQLMAFSWCEGLCITVPWLLYHFYVLH